MPESNHPVAHPLRLGLHGASCRLESNKTDFLNFAARYLEELHLDRDQLPSVYSRLHWGVSPPALWQGSAVRQHGRRLMHVDETVLMTDLLHLPGLQLEARWKSEALQMDAYYKPAGLLPGFAQRLPGARERIYTILLNYLVFFPLVIYLSQTRGLHLLHAGAVSSPRGVSLIAGLPGSGKSTLTLALLAEPEAKLVSDNLLLIDTERIYALPEPLHLSDVSRRIVPQAASQRLDDLERDFSHGRREYHLDQETRQWQAEPNALFLVGLASASQAFPLPTDKALELLLAFEQLSREIEAYQQFDAALSLIAPQPAPTPRKRSTLKALISGFNSYELWLQKGGGMAEAVELVHHRTSHTKKEGR